MDKADYLDFGGAEAARSLDVPGALGYLTAQGFGGGYLEQARAAVQAHRTRTFEFEPLNADYCDFCFAKLMGGEFDRLADGRERCVHCSRHVLRTHEQFVETFLATKSDFELGFTVQLNVPMTVRMVNANQIARRSGEAFEPTPGVDARVLGYAEKKADGCTLFIENGSPRLSAVITIAHELTHIWQYLNWDETEIDRRYGPQHALVVHEGMATWAQVQYLLLMGEFDDAERQEAYARQRTDEYGVGFRLFCQRYPLRRAAALGGDTPFRHRFPL